MVFTASEAGNVVPSNVGIVPSNTKAELLFRQDYDEMRHLTSKFVQHLNQMRNNYLSLGKTAATMVDCNLL